MLKMQYISFVRFPTEKAHGLQIAQNCEAFADAGYKVTLWVSTRKNIPEMAEITDIYAHYGVKPNFEIRRIPSIDLYPFAGGNTRLEYIAFWVHTISYCLMMILQMLLSGGDIFYSRDRYPLLALSLIVPRQKLAYEVHQFAPTETGVRIQRMIARRVKNIIGITPRLCEDFAEHYNVPSTDIHLAHDGIRAERFENLPDKLTARRQFGWDESAFIVGYSGRLHTMGKDKGVGSLVAVASQIEGITLVVVGGPDDMADALEQEWRKAGGNPDNFHKVGTVRPDEIPPYLASFDVCAMPFPWTEHYAYYMSPLKLFEYMASGNAILATALPSVMDVITHGETAYIVETGNPDALGEGLIALKNNPALRETMGENARKKVFEHYTWQERARQIKRHLEREIT